MSIQAFDNSGTVYFKEDYQEDEGARTIKAGEKGYVEGHDSVLVDVRMNKDGYRVCVRPMLLEQTSNN